MLRSSAEFIVMSIVANSNKLSDIVADCFASFLIDYNYICGGVYELLCALWSTQRPKAGDIGFPLFLRSQMAHKCV